MDNNLLEDINISKEIEGIDFKQEISRYLRFWPWFVLSIIIALLSVYVYLRYTPSIYSTQAKIKILDKSDGLELPSSTFVFKRTNINLENEIQILKSYLILEEVVKYINFNLSFYEEANIKTPQLVSLPFFFESDKDYLDSIRKPVSYEFYVDDKQFSITNLNSNKTYDFPNHNTYIKEHNLPFDAKISDKESLKHIVDKTFVIKFNTVRNTTLNLKSKINITPVGEQSDILALSINGENKEVSQKVLNTVIDVFNRDGINDRQLISERTLDFIDGRFLLLANELDSLELNLESFKKNNNLTDISVDSQISIEKRSTSEEEVFRIERQLSLMTMLDSSLKSTEKAALLPANLGIESGGINDLINQYNNAVINKSKLSKSGGKNNPNVKLADNEINNLKFNIDKSISNFINQLQNSQKQLELRSSKFSNQVSLIPAKERSLREKLRQQKIKESLYLLLLQKREEAAINLAITEPSIKVVEYAISNGGAVSPKPNIIYLGALLVALLIPFGIIYALFLLNTKLHNKEDIEKINPNIPVIAEIPIIKNENEKIFRNPNNHGILAESFRILSSNADYILPKNNDGKGKVIYCTSSIKGEGKTYISLNLSLALSSINKKVLLIGSDLRNPQIHNQINEDKHREGLSNYLHDSEYDWKDTLINAFGMHEHHHIILSGSIPPNPTHLLTNGRFEKLLEEAKLEYDYIIVDTAPTILVTDTTLISQFADATIFVTRADYTEKKLLSFSKELYKSGKLKNMVYVINAVGANKSYGYSYGYGYGYNYGYGYGYNSNEN